VRKDLMDDMKFIICKTIQSVRMKLNQRKMNDVFELFGFDFMCDQDLTVWLIECNKNPSLEISSNFKKDLLPRMIDDIFKLTLDKNFLSPIDD